MPTRTPKLSHNVQKAPTSPHPEAARGFYGRGILIFCWCLTLALLGGTVVNGQYVQGSDYATATQFADPANWTRTIIDTATTGTTITFKLNPCKWVVYMDVDGQPLSCMEEPVCTKIDDMGDRLQEALDVWNDLAGDALTLEWEHWGSCPGDKSGCPAGGVWEDDDVWAVTRTYGVSGNPVNCPDADTTALNGGAGLRFYEDPTSDRTTRWVRECDILFFENKWDNDVDACTNAGFTSFQCGGAWRMALAHEIGHCLGFGHTYLTRRILDPVEDDLDQTHSITLADEGQASIMAYDRPGSVQAFDDGFGPYDRARYLHTYATTPPATNHFTAYGTVVDCDTDDPILGAAVIALQKSSSPLRWRPVHLSLTGLDPLDEDLGEFSLEQLERGSDYHLIVLDARDSNQIDGGGWDFDDFSRINQPKLNVFKTDEWDEDHSSSAYKYDTVAKFTTGFDYVLQTSFTAPSSGDHDAGEICVTIP